MNLTHLKYALEVERTGSITKAAENLYMGQPNLSRVIKELEDATEIKIFSRTSKGIAPTENGRIFLKRARDIVRQASELENLFKNDKGRRSSFHVAGQSSSSLVNAFNKTVIKLNADGNSDCFLDECQSGEVLEQVIHGECGVGIMKSTIDDFEALQSALWERNVRCTTIGSYTYNLLFHKDHPLANSERITAEMLDMYTMTTSEGRVHAGGPARLLAYRSVTECVEILPKLYGSYMIARPFPRETLERYHLISRPYENDRGIMRDLLVYSADHKLTDAERIFAAEFRVSYWDDNGEPRTFDENISINI